MTSRGSEEEKRIRKLKMKCPKCGEVLQTQKFKTGNQWGHSYSFAEMMRGESICDYTVKTGEGTK